MCTEGCLPKSAFYRPTHSARTCDVLLYLRVKDHRCLSWHRLMEAHMLMRIRRLRRPSLVGVLAAPLLLTLGVAVSQAQQTPPALSGAASATSIVEPKVLDILKAACNVLSEAKTMSFTAVNTYERAASNGQPLY